jgi:hypothetical protein
MRKPKKKAKQDPFKEHVWYYLAIRSWHASYGGPRWKRTDIPHPDWRGGPDWIEHQYELEDEESLSLELGVEPYRQRVTVREREYHAFEFKIWSSAKPGAGGLLQICPDGELRGWASLPIAGVQALMTLLAEGKSVVLQIHASAFKRHDALVRSDSGWYTEGHPSLEDETA